MRGKLVVISGFSGAGKGTVISSMRKQHDGYVLSVSMTTRKPRKGETDGVEYHFVTNEVFEELIRNDGFLEHAGYADHYYGTPRAFVEENMNAGRDVLLEIEVQGAMQIRKKYPQVPLIFIAPPDAAELERRLTGRGTDQEEVVNKRLRQAVVEAEAIPDYDYLLINDHIEPCAFSLNRIIRGTEDADDDAEEMQSPAEGGEIITDPEKKKAFASSFSADLPAILERRGIIS